MAEEVIKCLPQSGSFGSMSEADLKSYVANAADMSRRAAASVDPLQGITASSQPTHQLKAGARVVHATKRSDQVAKYIGPVEGSNALHTIEYSDGARIKAKLSNLTIL